LVPFTIPLSWFYLGFSAYLIARAALASRQLPNFLAVTGAIGLGSLFLTSWDLVLDPAMSQTTLPFWMWEQPGAFFGMPYQNFAGWLGTGALFMSAATWIWSAKPLTLPRKQLELPLIVYLSNFTFATILSLAAGIYLPIFLGIILGVVPVLACYQTAVAGSKELLVNPAVSHTVSTKVSVAAAEIAQK
jgi:putative membrane protein